MRAEDNKFPYFTLAQATAPAILPDPGYYRVFIDTADGTLKTVDSTGEVNELRGIDGTDGVPSRILTDASGTYPARPDPAEEPVLFIGTVDAEPFMLEGDTWLNNDPTVVPETFYTAAEVDDLIAGVGGPSLTAEDVRDIIAAALEPGANVTITPNDAGDTIAIAATGGSGGGPSTHMVRVQRAAAFTFPTSTVTTIPWDAQAFDTEDLWVPGAPTRVTIKQAGLYAVALQIASDSTTGQVQGRINKNGVNVALNGITATANGATVQVSDLVSCQVGDYLEGAIYATQAGTRGIFNGAANCYMTVAKIGV